MCFIIHEEEWIITPLYFIQIQAFFKIFPTKLTGIVLFCFFFFPFWLCIFNLKINVHNKKKQKKQGPYLQQLHIRVSFLYSETLLAVDCEWQGKCF